jgi:hypothetical protein
MPDNTILEVNRSLIDDTRLVDEPVGELGPGQIRLRIDRYAVTANNITYAVFGDVLGYWDFFPAADGWGRVPAMGWAEIVESTNPDLPVGGRYYGWYPMARSVPVTATATADGFRDDGDHRQAHAAVYRAYVESGRDPWYDTSADGEDRHALLRGPFMTGFLADEFFGDSGGAGGEYFGAGRVVVLSASSKTAIGFAQRAAERGLVDVVGVTSARNRSFVSSLDFYDTVFDYDEIGSIGTDLETVSIDMAGDPAVLGALHIHLGDRLRYSMTVGRSHHDAAPAAPADLPGPAPQLFFAPTEVSRLQDQWGRSEYAARSADALADFVAGSREWLAVEHRMGSDGAQQAWNDVHSGAVSPSVGLVVTPG